MSTTVKGDAFENRVYNVLLKDLENGKLLVNPNQSKIFKKKAYYSKDRNSNIITDISIETSYENDEIGLYTIIECKDCQNTISVDDIEEFNSKLDQIAGRNMKGIFASTSALQKAAFNYAKSKGIGVFRFFPDKFIKLSFNKVEPTQSINDSINKESNVIDFVKGMFEEKYSENRRTFYGYYVDKPYFSLTTLINTFEIK